MTRTALVLGGGGVTGVAWEIGLLAGLADRGVDLCGADLIVGTSAGSVVGALLATGVELEQVYAAQLDDAGAEVPASLNPRLALTMARAAVTTRGSKAFRARIGRRALLTSTGPESARRAIISARLPVQDWPQRALRITAVEAASGEFVVFDRTSDVSLVDAVGASCAVPGTWPPVSIGGRRYIDGGMRSAANVDLAAGYDVVVVIAPINGFGRGTVTRQAAELRQHARVAVLRPDQESKVAIGRNVLDPSRRAPSAQAGRAQAASVADELRRYWPVAVG